jgi:hypothetical protein
MKFLLSERKRLSHTQRESLGSIIMIGLVVGMGRAITTLYKRLRKRNRCTSMTAGVAVFGAGAKNCGMLVKKGIALSAWFRLWLLGCF